MVNPEVRHEDDMDTTPADEIVAEKVGLRAARIRSMSRLYRERMLVLQQRILGRYALVLACWIRLYGQIIKTNHTALRRCIS